MNVYEETAVSESSAGQLDYKDAELVEERCSWVGMPRKRYNKEPWKCGEGTGDSTGETRGRFLEV